MDTTRQPQTGDSRRSARGRPGVRADALDLVVLIVIILVLTGAAAGIAIAFPQALDIIAAQASAATAPSSEMQEPEHASQPADAKEEENEPFFADDIRSTGAIYAFVPGADSAERSASDASDARPR